jgi:type II secretory pathway component PulJ
MWWDDDKNGLFHGQARSRQRECAMALICMDKAMSRRGWLRSRTDKPLRVVEAVQVRKEEMCDVAKRWVRAWRVLSRLNVDGRWGEEHRMHRRG